MNVLLHNDFTYFIMFVYDLYATVTFCSSYSILLP
jgi:hypothetical protein